MTAERKQTLPALISRRKNESQKSTFVPFRGSYSALPIVSLPVEMPILRADNGRLAVLKTAYLKEHGLQEDHFQKNQTDQTIQSVLQSFLLGLSKDKQGPIFQELRRTAIQTEPILTTADGVVLNGNRRLSAMRALFAEDPDRFSTFAEVEVAIMPEDANAADLEMTEAALQMAPDTKLAYGWIDRRLKLRNHREIKTLSDDDILQNYRMATPAEIDEELEELEDVECYLADLMGKPRDYPQIADAEAYFVGMRKTLAHLPDDDRETWKRAGFAMIAASNEVKIEPERYFPFSAAEPAYAPSRALVRFGNEENLWPPRTSEDAADTLNERDHAELRRVFSERERSKDIASALMKHFDRLLTEFREEQLTSPRHLIQSAHHLNRQLAKTGPDNFDEAQRRELGALLAETQYHARIIANEKRQTFVEKVLSHIAGWIYFLRRKALLISKGGVQKRPDS